jgi:histidinol-phosphate/aromatic aminotransferase/cobyric acid decarboxylase-like protein
VRPFRSRLSCGDGQGDNVIVDEAYLEFEPDFAQKTAVELTRSGANVVVFRTFGKIYGLAGMPAARIASEISYSSRRDNRTK